jgi:hypothetical protein
MNLVRKLLHWNRSRLLNNLGVTLQVRSARKVAGLESHRRLGRFVRTVAESHVWYHSTDKRKLVAVTYINLT